MVSASHNNKDTLLYSTRQQLIVLNQINTILSSLINTEQVVSALLCIFLTHEFFNFNQIYVFSVSESEGMIQGDYCLGYGTNEEKKKAMQQIKKEVEKLQSGMNNQKNSSDETAVRLLFHELMDMTAYICHTRAKKKNTSLYTGQKICNYRVSYYDKESGIPLNAIQKRKITLFTDHVSYEKDGLKSYLPPPPLLFIPLVSGNRVFKLIVASKCLDASPAFDKVEVALIEWILKRLTFILENCRRYEEMEKAYQELRQIDQIKTDFTSIISHELQTPLVSIIGYSHLLADYKLGEINPKQKKALNTIISKAEYLHDQVGQLLFKARIDSRDAWKEERQNIGLRSLLEDIIRHYQQKTYDKEVEFRLNFPREKVCLFTRPQMMRNMICILVGNAVKFSKSSVRIDISVHLGRDNSFHIEVKDNGIGISPKERESIFKPFFQVQKSLQREYPGMGVGLSTLQELINQLHGKILVKSVPGRGSTFELILPAEQVFQVKEKENIQ